MTDEEKQKILGRKPTPNMYYRLDDYRYSTTPKDRVLSGIQNLDTNISGFEMGCITLWTGFTNAGKTTVMTTMAKRTIDQGERIFFFNGEQTKEDFKNNLYIQCVDSKFLIHKQYKNSGIEDTFVMPEKATELEKMYGNKIYVYNNEMDRSINSLLYAMEELRKTQKIRVFFLDNFMQIDVASENVYLEQTAIMEKLRTFAINNRVHIHLVAHPRKTERNQVRLSLYDIAGSSNMVNKAYNIVAIMRTDNLKKDSKSYEKLEAEMVQEGYDINCVDTILEVLKTKGKSCGLIGLKYDKEKKTYTEAPHLTSEAKEKKIHEHKYQEIEEPKQEELPW